MKALNAILVQLNPKLRDVRGNVEMVSSVLSQSTGLELAVFPELFLGGYTTEGVENLALDLEGPEVGEMARLARESDVAVIFGLHERVASGVANSAVCLDRRGNLAGCYRKTHLFGDERGAFVAGDELLIVDLEGVEAGLMICFDVEFPEVARSLATAGAELLVTISANMDPFGRDHDVFATARALENGLPHLYVNQVGQGEAFTFAGGTMAVSADGDNLAEAGVLEGEIEVSLDLSARSEERPE
ncbi:MAG: nitrilase-related carbon-nitrogen hydrolase, partial [Rubrobacter sp.]